MTKEQYAEWRNHPATLFFRKFLKDRASYLIREATEHWLNGSVIFDKENQVTRGAIAELLRMTDVSFEDIENFYKDTENGTEVTEAVSR